MKCGNLRNFPINQKEHPILGTNLKIIHQIRIFYSLLIVYCIL
jgi:hypothetical protein